MTPGREVLEACRAKMAKKLSILVTRWKPYANTEHSRSFLRSIALDLRIIERIVRSKSYLDQKRLAWAMSMWLYDCSYGKHMIQPVTLMQLVS